MKVLIDENLPRKLAGHLKGHECRTVAECGWAGKKNGELLSWAEPQFEISRSNSAYCGEGILVGLMDSCGDDTAGYSAKTLRTFVLDRSRPHGIERTKSIVVAVRSFVRFLSGSGRWPMGMEHAIP